MSKLKIVGISTVSLVAFAGCCSTQPAPAPKPKVIEKKIYVPVKKQPINQTLNINIKVTPKKNVQTTDCCLDVNAPINPYIDNY